MWITVLRLFLLLMLLMLCINHREIGDIQHKHDVLSKEFKMLSDELEKLKAK